MSDKTAATAYVQIRKDGIWGKVVRMTQRAPSVVEPGCLVVKIKFLVPNTWFQTPFLMMSVPEPPTDSIETEIEVPTP